MTKKFSDFGNASNGGGDITPVGLQAGGNVQIPKATFAWWIQQAITTALTWAFSGNISASNLSGTNTGDETFARIAALGFYGYTKSICTTSAVVTSFSKNRITANSVALTTPAAPADFDDFYIYVESGSITSPSVVANSGQTVNGAASLALQQGYFHFQYDLANTDWFITDYRIGTL